MPNVKISNLINDYLTNFDKYKAPRNTANDIVSSNIALDKSKALAVNIINAIEKKYGSDKAEKLIETLLTKKALAKARGQMPDATNEELEQAAKQEIDNSIKQFKDKHLMNRARRIASDTLGNSQKVVPGKDIIRQISDQNNIKNMGDLSRIGYDKYYNLCIEAVGDELKEYVANTNPVSSGILIDDVLDNFADGLTDPELALNFDDELNIETTAFDKTEREIKDPYKPELISSLKGVVNDPKKAEELEDVSYILGSTNDKANSTYSSLRDLVERDVTAKTKDVMTTTYEKKAEEVYDQEMLQTFKNQPDIVYVVKDGGEAASRDFKNDNSIKINDQAKEGIREAFKKFDEMGIKVGQSEESTKVYGFSNLINAQKNLRAIADNLAETEAKIQENKQKLEAEQDAQKKRELEAEAKTLEENRLDGVNKLLEAKENYNKADKDLEDLRNICGKYFGNTKLINTNVDISRNGAMPKKYREDIVSSSQINGLFFTYSMLKDHDIKLEDFLADPGKVTQEAFEKRYDEKTFTLSEEDAKKPLAEQLNKVINYNDFADKRNLGSNDSGTALRALDFVTSLDDENYVTNVINAKKVTEACDAHSLNSGRFKVFGDNAIETYERILATGGPVKDMIADDHYDPVNRRIIKGKSVDIDSELKKNPVTAEELINRYNQIVDVIIAKNLTSKDDNPQYIQSSKIQASEDIAKVTEAFRNEALKYVEINGVDPEYPGTKLDAILVNSIVNPKGFIQQDMGVVDFTDERVKFKDKMDDISFLKRSDLDITSAKKKLDTREKQLLKAEKAFDKQMKRDKKELDKQVDRLLKNNPTKEKYEAAEQLQMAYQKKLTDHDTELFNKCRNGEIPVGFYYNRSIQIMSGEPIGNLKFYDHYLSEAIKKEDFIADHEKFNLTEKEAGKVYKALADRVSNEREIMAREIAREDKRLNKNLKLNHPGLELLDILKGNRERESNVVKDFDEPKQEIVNPNNEPVKEDRVQIHVDLGENKNSPKKSEFIKNDNVVNKELENNKVNKI